MTFRTADGKGSGWAGTAHNDWARVTPAAQLADRAVRKANGTRDAAPLDPGKYTVVLEPTAAGNLLSLLAFSMNARNADEGRSFFSKRGGGNKIGEKIVDERVTILSDPQDPDLLTSPFTGEGLPIGRTAWIENGVLKNLAYDRFWAEKQGVKPTPFGGGFRFQGVSPAASPAGAGAGAGANGQGRAPSLDDLIKTGAEEEGWTFGRGSTHAVYHRQDGVPIERGGWGRRAELRFNESPIATLNNLVAIGRPERVSSSESGDVGGAAVVVPPLVVRDFSFTSASEAV
jgi:predicted Zn-dependent protease